MGPQNKATYGLAFTGYAMRGHWQAERLLCCL